MTTNLFNRAANVLLAVALASLLHAAPASATETITYLHTDIAGSPVAATDANGTIVWRESYRPYGERTKNQAASASNRQFFHDKPFDQDTGLSFFGARYYDPVVGRFMGVDPKDFEEDNLHSFNRYAYGNNNPYKFRDGDGRGAELLIPILIFIGVVAIASGYRPPVIPGPGRLGRPDLGEGILLNENSRESGSASNNNLGGNSAPGGAIPPDDDGKGSGTPTDRYKSQLTNRNLDAARRELNNEVVARKPDGSPYDHVTKVRNAMRGLRNRIDEINNKLGSPSAQLSDAERSSLTSELGEASRLLDHAKNFLQ
jgi:RHS repeat-associated protein